MNNLEKILGRIREDQAEEIARLEKNSRARREKEQEEILAGAKEEATRLTESARLAAAETEKNIPVTAGAVYRRAVLQEKAQLTSLLIEKGKADVAALPDGEYFDFLLSFFPALPAGGEVRFARREAEKRALSLFAEKLAQTGKNFALSKETTDEIESGCVVIYGKIEENLSLEALIAEKEDELADAFLRLLEEKA